MKKFLRNSVIRIGSIYFLFSLVVWAHSTYVQVQKYRLLQMIKSGQENTAVLILGGNINPNLRDDDTSGLSEGDSVRDYITMILAIWQRSIIQHQHPAALRPTVLMLASERGETAVVHALLAKGANVNLRDVQGNTALILAAKTYFKATYPNTNPALGKSTEQVMQMLLDQGADMYAKNKAHFNALNSFCPLLIKRSASAPYAHELVQAVNKNDVESVKRLLALGANPNSVAADDETVEPVLWTAIANQNRTIIHMLLDKGADPDMEGRFGTPILMKAIYTDQPDIVQALIDKGADVNVQNDRGFSALYIAGTHWDGRHCVDVLEKAGAK